MVESKTLPSAPPASLTAVSLVAAAALFMLILDGAILNTSLPQVAKGLGVGPVEMNLGITAYILTVAIFTPISAWVADRFGAKIIFVIAIGIFTAASVGCALANSLPTFVAARVVQGVGGAILSPIGRIIVLRSANPSELMRATSTLTWPALIAPVIGPVIGGAITSFFGWRWNFFLNVPIGLAGIAFALAIVPDTGERVRRPLDAVGTALTASALFLLISGLGRLGDGSSLTQSVGMFLAGGALAGAAIIWLRRHAHPLLRLEALKLPTFATSALSAGSLSVMATNATPFLLPLMMQAAWGFSPLRAGEWLMFYFLGNLLMKAITTQVLRRWGFRSVMAATGLWIGASIAAFGLLRPTLPQALLALALLLAGAARSMQLTALNTLAFADVPGHQRSSSSTLLSMLQQLSMAIGIAVAAVTLNLAKAMHGGGVLRQSDFQWAFLVCGAAGAVGGLICLRLEPAAGAEVSGHKLRAIPSPTA